VVAVVAAQEVQKVFMGYQRGKDTHGKAVNFGVDKADRAVTVYYCYVLDADFGPGFIKLCSYFPSQPRCGSTGTSGPSGRRPRPVWPSPSWPTALPPASSPSGSGRSATSSAPPRSRDSLPAGSPRSHALTATDRAAGYWWELSMRQVEVSRTIVFDDPRRARGFFAALVADNVGVGRPEQVAILFARQVHTTTKEPFRTRVFGPGTQVKLDFACKHARVKQSLKQGRALRIETVINKPYDIGVLARLAHRPELVARARAVNGRLLMIQRAGQGCAIETALFERVSQPYVREGQRTGALRLGDPRAMALAGALCRMVHAVAGFTNKRLRSLVAGLLGADYTSAQMTYDLRRLRLHGLITRLPGTHTYVTTPDGLRVAAFSPKLGTRVLAPLPAADRPPAPIQVRRALATLDRAVNDYVTNARLGTTA
jgi:hypothetical protein